MSSEVPSVYLAVSIWLKRIECYITGSNNEKVSSPASYQVNISIQFGGFQIHVCFCHPYFICQAKA